MRRNAVDSVLLTLLKNFSLFIPRPISQKLHFFLINEATKIRNQVVRTFSMKIINWIKDWWFLGFLAVDLSQWLRVANSKLLNFFNWVVPYIILVLEPVPSQRQVLQLLSSFKIMILSVAGIQISRLMLWLSKERNCCRFNCATFRLPLDSSLCCLSKEFTLKKEEIHRCTVKWANPW